MVLNDIQILNKNTRPRDVDIIDMMKMKQNDWAGIFELNTFVLVQGMRLLFIQTQEMKKYKK